MHSTSKNWNTRELGTLVGRMDSGWSPKCDNGPTTQNNQWGVLKTTAIQANRFDSKHHKALPPSLAPRPDFELQGGELLVTRAGPSHRVGVAAFVRNCRPRLMISDKIIRIVFADPKTVSGEWIALTINNGIGADYLKSKQTGMDHAQMNISQDRLRLTPIPLPPLEEQHRIVAKVDALMALCDQLEARLQATQALQSQLAAAAVHHLDL